MIKTIKNTVWIMPALVGIILFSSCKKDKVPTPATTPVPELTKWEVIPGTYKMYDTLGNYMHDMSIQHWYALNENGDRKDTFQFTNFNGEFSFKNFQIDANITNLPKYFFYVGSHQPLYDQNNDRWQLWTYNAYYSNDSIYLSYKLHNILYYIEDTRPYESIEIKQFGIKQH